MVLMPVNLSYTRGGDWFKARAGKKLDQSQQKKTGMMVHHYLPSYMGNLNRRIVGWARPKM
jgi:hypothetical protein